MLNDNLLSVNAPNFITLGLLVAAWLLVFNAAKKWRARSGGGAEQAPDPNNWG